MKFKIKRQTLLTALAKVSRAVSLKSPLPILTGIKFDLEEDGLVLTGSDSDITIQTKIIEDIDIEEVGSIVLSSKYILEIIRKIDAEMVSIKIIDGTLTRIQGNKSKFNLNGSESFNYPRVDLMKKGTHVVLNSYDLKAIIDQTSYATSDRETRPVLTGVNMRAGFQELHCIATDGYRLAQKRIDIEDDATFNIVIPKKSLVEISRIIDRNEDIDLYVSDRKVLVEVDHYLLSTRLIDGTYPDTSRLTPDTYSSIMTINSSALLGSIDRASLLSDEDTNIVKLTMNEDQVVLSSNSKEIGSVEELLDIASFDGESLDISFNAKYLTDSIRSINSETVKIQFTGKMRPFVITDIESDDNIQVILPVRTF